MKPVILLSAAAMLLGACSPATKPASTSPPDPCQLITRTQASALVGQALVRHPEKTYRFRHPGMTADAVIKQCTYYAVQRAVVQISIGRLPSLASAYATFNGAESVVKGSPGEKKITNPRIGKKSLENLWHPAPGLREDVIQFLKGDVYVSIEAAGPGTSLTTLSTRLTALARAVASRI